MRILPILLLLPFLHWGCSDDPRMTDEQFVAFFVAMSQATNQYADAPVKLREAHQRLYREYETTPETVQATIAHYQEHPEKWGPILERIGEELKRAEGKVQFQSPKSKVQRSNGCQIPKPLRQIVQHPGFVIRILTFGIPRRGTVYRS